MSTEETARVPAALDLPAQGPLPGHKVDAEKPTLLKAQVADDMLHLVLQRGAEHGGPGQLGLHGDGGRRIGSQPVGACPSIRARSR